MFRTNYVTGKSLGIIAGQAAKNQIAGFCDQMFHQMESLDLIDFLHVERIV